MGLREVQDNLRALIQDTFNETGAVRLLDNASFREFKGGDSLGRAFRGKGWAMVNRDHFEHKDPNILEETIAHEYGELGFGDDGTLESLLADIPKFEPHGTNLAIAVGMVVDLEHALGYFQRDPNNARYHYLGRRWNEGESAGKIKREIFQLVVDQAVEEGLLPEEFSGVKVTRFRLEGLPPIQTQELI